MAEQSFRVVNLETAIDELQAKLAATGGTHEALAVSHPGRMTAVLFCFRRGHVLQDHAAPGPVSIHALRGSLRVRVVEETETVALAAGSVLLLDPGVHHSVEAVEDSALLVTIGAAPSGVH